MAKFEIYTDKKGEFRFRLKTGEGQIILASEGYTSKIACDNGIVSVKRNSKIYDRYLRKQSKDGKHYFVLKASNGKTIGKSPLFNSKTGLEGGIITLKEE